MSTDDRIQHDAAAKDGEDVISELPKKAVDADDAEAVKGGIMGNLPGVQLPPVQKVYFTGGV